MEVKLSTPRPSKGRNFLAVDRVRAANVITTYTGLANVNLGGVVDIADSEMRDCVEMLKKTKDPKSGTEFYKDRKTQELIRGTFKQYERLKALFYKNVEGREQIYMDMLDIIQDDIRPDIQKLYYPIKNVLDKNGVALSAMRAQAELVHMICVFACHVCIGLIRASSAKSGIDTTPLFELLNPRPYGCHWGYVCDRICDYSEAMPLPEGRISKGRTGKLRKEFNIGIQRQIAEDKTVQIAQMAIIEKLVDVDKLNECCEKAMKMNPEMKAEYDEAHPMDECLEDIRERDNMGAGYSDCAEAFRKVILSAKRNV